MEKSKRIMPQIYGYLICLVSVITFLISIGTMVNAVMDLSDPIHSRYSNESLASYEIYKMDVIKSTKSESPTAQTSYVPDEPSIRAMYEAARADKIQSVKHSSYKTIIVDSILILICIVLFVTHWRWMRHLSKSND